MNNNILHIIGGTESTGSAGIQTDIKTSQSIGIYSTTTLSCIVSFSPDENLNHLVHIVENSTFEEQLASTQYVLQPKFAKVGMLGSKENILSLAKYFENNKYDKIVIDPVLICKGEEEVSNPDSLDKVLIDNLIKFADVLTPNLLEAEILSGKKIQNVDDMIESAKIISQKGAETVIVKGGHRLEGSEAIDVVYLSKTDEYEILSSPKIDKVVSGAGCTFASAVASYAAKGESNINSAKLAKEFVTKAISNSFKTNAPFYNIKQS